jgi:uncharacterized protein (TIGR00255 family)
MTGFASKTVTLTLETHEKAHLTISLKSLNSRFFEATCKLHYQLNSLETEFLKILKNALHRGHVYLIIHMDNQNLFKGAVEPSIKTIDGYVKAIDVIKQQFGIQGSLSVADLLLLPNVFSIEEIDIDEQSKQLVLKTVNELAGDLVLMQEKEGQALKKDLEQRIAIMHKEIEAIEHASNVLMATQKEKVHNTFKELESDESKVAEMQKSAAYTLLDKMDIHEEIVRFKSHLKSLSNQLDSADVEKGKRLDFTLQELAREINTIAAKCSDATIGALAINVKVELEKAREQTQNIV